METQTVYIAKPIAEAAGIVQLGTRRKGKGYQASVEVSQFNLDKVLMLNIPGKSVQLVNAVRFLREALGVEVPTQQQEAA